MKRPRPLELSTRAIVKIRSLTHFLLLSCPLQAASTDGVGLVTTYSDSNCSSGAQSWRWTGSGKGCSQISPNRWGNGVCVMGGDTLYVTVYGDSSCASSSSAYTYHNEGQCQSIPFPPYNMIWTCGASSLAFPFISLALLFVAFTIVV